VYVCECVRACVYVREGVGGTSSALVVCQ
jgi:hypothetical protein